MLQVCSGPKSLCREMENIRWFGRFVLAWPADLADVPWAETVTALAVPCPVVRYEAKERPIGFPSSRHLAQNLGRGPWAHQAERPFPCFKTWWCAS